MNEEFSLSNIDFIENGQVDAKELNALYRLIGWDSNSRRTKVETREMLEASRYYTLPILGMPSWWDSRACAATRTMYRCSMLLLTPNIVVAGLQPNVCTAFWRTSNRPNMFQ